MVDVDPTVVDGVARPILVMLGLEPGGQTLQPGAQLGGGVSGRVVDHPLVDDSIGSRVAQAAERLADDAHAVAVDPSGHEGQPRGRRAAPHQTGGMKAVLDRPNAELQLNRQLVCDRGELEVAVRRVATGFVLGATGVGELQHRRRGPRLCPSLFASAPSHPIEQGVGA